MLFLVLIIVLLGRGFIDQDIKVQKMQVVCFKLQGRQAVELGGGVRFFFLILNFCWIFYRILILQSLVYGLVYGGGTLGRGSVMRRRFLVFFVVFRVCDGGLISFVYFGMGRQGFGLEVMYVLFLGIDKDLLYLVFSFLGWVFLYFFDYIIFQAFLCVDTLLLQFLKIILFV